MLPVGAGWCRLLKCKQRTRNKHDIVLTSRTNLDQYDNMTQLSTQPLSTFPHYDCNIIAKVALVFQWLSFIAPTDKRINCQWSDWGSFHSVKPWANNSEGVDGLRRWTDHQGSHIVNIYRTVNPSWCWLPWLRKWQIFAFWNWWFIFSFKLLMALSYSGNANICIILSMSEHIYPNCIHVKNLNLLYER